MVFFLMVKICLVPNSVSILEFKNNHIKCHILKHLTSAMRSFGFCAWRKENLRKPSLFTSEFNMYKPYLWASHLLLTTNLCHPRVTHSQKAMRKGQQSSAWILCTSWVKSWTAHTLGLPSHVYNCPDWLLLPASVPLSNLLAWDL